VPKEAQIKAGHFVKETVDDAVCSGSWDVYTMNITVGQTGIIMAKNERKKEAARIYGDLAQVL
jgi:hypothetical protein